MDHQKSPPPTPVQKLCSPVTQMLYSQPNFGRDISLFRDGDHINQSARMRVLDAD